MNLSHVPFSYRGSYMAVGYCDENYCGCGNPAGIYLRTVSGGAPMPLVLRFQPTVERMPVDYTIRFTGEALFLQTTHGSIAFAYENAETLLCEANGQGLGLLLDEICQTDSCNYVHPIVPDDNTMLCINCYKNHTRHLFATTKGALHLQQTWDCEEARACTMQLEEENGSFGFFLREINTAVNTAPPAISVAQAAQGAAQQIMLFCGKCAPAYAAAARDAAYVQWASTVAPRGFVQRETMLMSKNWMTSVWAWDHCFNAMALCKTNPTLAFDQFMTMFDHQQTDGLIPDFLNDSTRFFNCVKLPVHGWALRHMMRRCAFSDTQKAQAYEKLAHWTNWWLTSRDLDKDGLCEYWHGNDSGWDNGTVFASGPCVISPELSAFLVVQMDVLAHLSTQLGNESQAQIWHIKVEELAKNMTQTLFQNNLPVALQADSRAPIACKSLLPYLSLVAAAFLPKQICDAMVQMLADTNAFMTPHGLASEMPSSAFFVENGYWRGAIWPPVQFILADALTQCGAKTTALEIKRKFCELASKNGFAENYSCLSGAPLRDKAYTWAASVFALFLEDSP